MPTGKQIIKLANVSGLINSVETEKYELPAIYIIDTWERICVTFIYLIKYANFIISVLF